MPSGLPHPLPTHALRLTLDEAELVRLAGLLAERLTAGDCIALRGDLGTGKTTFARALVRAVLKEPALDVPSPTFALRQDYGRPEHAVVHFDLYRIADARDLDELGFDETLGCAITVIEWPERAGDVLPHERIEVRLTESAAADRRNVTLTGWGAAAATVAGVEQALAGQ